jgi:hypothetical protein
MRAFTVAPFAQVILHLSKLRAQLLHHGSSGSGAELDSVTVGDDALFSGLQGDFPGEPRQGTVCRDRFAPLHGFSSSDCDSTAPRSVLRMFRRTSLGL